MLETYGHLLLAFFMAVKVKDKVIPLQAQYGPEGG